MQFFTPGMRHMLISAFAFSIMGLLVRLLHALPFMEIIMARSMISLAICIVYLRRLHLSLLGEHRMLLFLRGLFGFIALSVYFYTLQHLPLAEAVTIQYMNPLFTSFLAPLMLKEKGNGREWIASLIAFAGVWILAKPESLSQILPVAAGVFGAICSAVAYNIVRKLGLKGEDPMRIVLYFPLVAFVLGTPLAIPSFVVPGAVELLLLAGIGLATQVGQVSLTKGLRAERAAKATVVNYLVIALGTLYSIILGESLTLTTFAGMALIVAAIAIVNAAGAKGAAQVLHAVPAPNKTNP